MLRPREGHDIHIEQLVLEVIPAHSIRWIRDVHGNSIALVDFTQRASELVFSSDVILHHYEVNPFDFYIEPEALRFPFSYKQDTAVELSALIQPAFPEDFSAVREWLSAFWRHGQEMDTLDLLQQINGGIGRLFRYQIRHEEGVQSPMRTFANGSGSCRDFAALFVEACRNLGLGARFVSGYILNGGAPGGEASTHAWAEVYLPGVGWKGFDPTLGILTTSQHVTVAVARHPEGASPISGSYLGPGNAFLGIDVQVRVHEASSEASPLD